MYTPAMAAAKKAADDALASKMVAAATKAAAVDIHDPAALTAFVQATLREYEAVEAVEAADKPEAAEDKEDKPAAAEPAAAGGAGAAAPAAGGAGAVPAAFKELRVITHAVPPALEAEWTEAAELLDLAGDGLCLSTKADALTAWMQLALMQAHWLISVSTVDEHGDLGNALVRIVARLFETKIADDVRVYPHVAYVTACIDRTGDLAFALNSFSAITEAAAVAAVDYMVGDEGTVDPHDILEMDWPKHVRKAAVKQAIELGACWHDEELAELGIDAEGNDLEVEEDGEKRQDDDDEDDEEDEDEDEDEDEEDEEEDEDEEEEEHAKQPAAKRARKAAAADK
jgi:hypothetical protein